MEPGEIFGVARALARNPAAVAAIVAAGHEVAGHGLRWLSYQSIHGSGLPQHPAPGRRAWRLRQRFGLLADDHPYWTEVSGHNHLVVPYAMDTNDMRLASPGGFATHRRADPLNGALGGRSRRNQSCADYQLG